MSELQDKPRRGRGLTRGRIARAALDLVDERGVGAASMRAIAARLDVQAMSLYKHFATREEMLDAVVELIVEELDADPQVRHDASDGWRDYLARLAHGVRRYAIAHPHAFPLVATRPAQAPWINPPLRSLSWIENLFTTLAGERFTDDQLLFTYRSFNTFLLGYLLMETGARTLSDPQPGDGTLDSDDPSYEQPVPGGLEPTRSAGATAAIARADAPAELLDPQNRFAPEQFPVVTRLADRLAEDHYGAEFSRALEDLLDRVGAQLG